MNIYCGESIFFEAHYNLKTSSYFLITDVLENLQIILNLARK